MGQQILQKGEINRDRGGQVQGDDCNPTVEEDTSNSTLKSGINRYWFKGDIIANKNTRIVKGMGRMKKMVTRNWERWCF